MGDPIDDDRALVGRMLDGDEAAFTRFFDGQFPRLYRFALTRLDGDEAATEEVVQAALCRAIAGLAGYRGEAALFTWLCTICRRGIAEHRERRGRRLDDVPLREENPEVRAALDSLAALGGSDPETAAQRREIARQVQVILDALPGAYGDALEWKYLEGRSVREIAARLDLSVKAAESMLTRAREAFRDGFAAMAHGAPGAATRE
ncbi:MAG TPA: RNA polymerase sigma factor [Dongiaceae bacterium]|nr:RNA polymerase sigma factor [Dongiaceae bacterium]